ncbi:MAG: bifunctional phosphoribosylaminoimidazolecarboxamide formyltransferase/IMP cyclohydrolase [Bacillota bacterium]|nr:bifunctional phosphoribosylaminoimidazolecarboxamide formyltransferase/IMP cyclohydrolase [Bacillota bacterium]
MKKRALISVFDKTNILDLAKGLDQLGWQIISTGGTYKHLKENGLEPIEISEVTKFPEILDGRVKTLNPLIHGGILYRRDHEDHVQIIKDHNIGSIDMVVNNLYPFSQKLKAGADHEEMIENIDIGGPSMIRAAAKNYKDVLILTDPADYQEVLEELEKGDPSLDLKADLARKAFSYTAQYDGLIAAYFNRHLGIDYPEKLTLTYDKVDQLRYGENPHQGAAFYKDAFDDLGIEIKQLHGKELSYNNLNDIFSTVKAVKEFSQPAAVGVKHTNPSGIGVGESIYEAYMRAYECDPTSIFGGIFALNRPVDEKTADHMASYFLEVIIAPGFSDQALEILTKKKNLRLIEIKDLNDFSLNKMTFKQVLSGIVYQDQDYFSEKEKDFDFETVTKRQATEKELADLKFAWLCVKNVASNGVVLAKDGATVGIGQGEVRRSWAVEEAIERAGEKIQGTVLGSDAFFFEDTVEALHEAGVKAMISPGGSIKDQAVIDLCDKYDMTLIFTKTRHFRH